MNTAISTLPSEPAPAQGQRLPSWKDELNARLAAHRTRREQSGEEQPSLPGMESAAGHKQPRGSRPQSVAARVAERYLKAPSYEEMLAAARAAEAAAVAAKKAHHAAQAMLAGLNADAPQQEEVHAAGQEPAEEIRRHYSASYHQPLPQRPKEESTLSSAAQMKPGIALADPIAEATVAPAQPLPAKLIQFPRELVAARKARPRRDEGPLLEEAAPQLRIFEVEHQTAAQPLPPIAEAPEWHSIRLDGPAMQADVLADSPAPAPETSFDLPLRTARFGDRLMAGIIDAALVLFAFLLFVLVFAACTTHPPAGKEALFGAGAALGGLFVLYQWLFFTYAEATPGMLYAKIALCTFEDENPDRHAMRHRVAALLLAALPLGLGFAWAFFDEDRLGWHDRMSRTYQRSYR